MGADDQKKAEKPPKKPKKPPDKPRLPLRDDIIKRILACHNNTLTARELSKLTKPRLVELLDGLEGDPCVCEGTLDKTLDPTATCAPPEVKKTRNRKKKPGALSKIELVQRILGHPGNSLNKAALNKLSKLVLCEKAMEFSLVDKQQQVASLPTRSEGRKCYLWTLLRETRLRDPVDRYVRWWSQVWARGSLIINGFAVGGGIDLASLTDLTALKKLLYPERYTPIELPEGLHSWLNATERASAFVSMRPRAADGGLEKTTIGDQAMTYMARRYRGNLKGHLLTHLHVRVFRHFQRRNSIERKDLPLGVKKALINGSFEGVAPEDAWRVVRFREWLGVAPEDVVGRRFASDDSHADEEVADSEEDPDVAPNVLGTAWLAHNKMCRDDCGTSLMPLAELKRQHAVLDARIVYSMTRVQQTSKIPPSQRLPIVPEAEVMQRYFGVSKARMRRRKALRRKTHAGRARRQYLRSYAGRMGPKDGVLTTVQTDGVAASPTFTTPIVRRKQVILKFSDLEGICALNAHHASTSSSHSWSSPLVNAKGIEVLTAEEVAMLSNARRAAGDPGGTNILTSVELGRRSRDDGVQLTAANKGLFGCSCSDTTPLKVRIRTFEGGHRAVIHTHLSLKNYERRSLKHRHSLFECQRRKKSSAYREAINTLSEAGKWSTADPTALDVMLAAQARAWPGLLDELVDKKEHVKWKMLSYRRRRMLLDQTVQRILRPTKDHVPDRRKRGIVFGYGNAAFGTRGPRLLMIKAMVRAMRDLRNRGLPAILVFVDEFRTDESNKQTLLNIIIKHYYFRVHVRVDATYLTNLVSLDSIIVLSQGISFKSVNSSRLNCNICNKSLKSNVR